MEARWRYRRLSVGLLYRSHCLWTDLTCSHEAVWHSTSWKPLVSLWITLIMSLSFCKWGLYNHWEILQYVDQEGFSLSSLCRFFIHCSCFYMYLCKEGFFKAIMLSPIVYVPCSIQGLSAFPKAQPMVKRRAGTLEQAHILS